MSKKNMTMLVLGAAPRTVGQLEQRFNAIMNSRYDIGLQHAGQLIRLKVSGNPQLGWYDPKLDLIKDIYSLNANKLTVVDSPWFAENHAKAIALEAAGNTAEADALFNELLNKTQLTFSQINRDGMKPTFGSNQFVDCMIEVADVQDRDEAGNRLETSHRAVVVNTASAVQAAIASKSKRFGADVAMATALANVREAQAATPEVVTPEAIATEAETK
jgi:hypothetical protein